MYPLRTNLPIRKEGAPPIPIRNAVEFSQAQDGAGVEPRLARLAALSMLAQEPLSGTPLRSVGESNKMRRVAMESASLISDILGVRVTPDRCARYLLGTFTISCL